MTSRQPARTGPRRARPAAPYRRRRALLVAILALIAVAAIALPRHLLGTDGAPSALSSNRGSGTLVDDESAYRSTDGWPASGQGAYVLGTGRPAVSQRQQPVPIASLAKVMTAYLIVKHSPLRAGENGRSFLVGQHDVEDTETRRHEDQSVVGVRAGEQLTEREALMAILLPSANNVAVLVARQVAGSVPAFVAEMNRTAHALGMTRTTYTDPSGYDEGTVSTALDQLRLAQVVARDETLAAMMATPSYLLPVSGVVTNTNTLLGRDGFVGMKTGSLGAAGGCFMFRVVWPGAGGNVTLTGVVLGQEGHSLIGAGLAAAQQLVAQLSMPSARDPVSD